MRFRKRPVEVEAVQLDGTPDGCRRVHDFLGWEHNDAGDCPGPIVIDTLEGDMWCQLGDWVVKGVRGEFYPVKPDIFAATYEPVEPSASGGDEACKTRTVHGCWCDLPNGHDGPHRSYDDPEPEPASGGDEARRSSPTDVTNVGCERCGGTGKWTWTDSVTLKPDSVPCRKCGGRGHA